MKSEHDEINNFAEHIVDSAMRAKELVERLNRAVQGEKKESIQQVEVGTDLQDVPSVAATRSGLQNILINLIFNCR